MFNKFINSGGTINKYLILAITSHMSTRKINFFYVVLFLFFILSNNAFSQKTVISSVYNFSPGSHAYGSMSIEKAIIKCNYHSNYNLLAEKTCYSYR